MAASDAKLFDISGGRKGSQCDNSLNQTSQQPAVHYRSITLPEMHVNYILLQ